MLPTPLLAESGPGRAQPATSCLEIPAAETRDLRRYFTIFSFEDLPASDRRSDDGEGGASVIS
jgi:hypothetical protein